MPKGLKGKHGSVPGGSNGLHRSFKAQGILDPFSAAVVFIAVAMIFILMAVLWHQAAPQLVAGITNSTNANTILHFGNYFYNYTADTLLVVFYFVLILGAFIGAYYEGANAMSLPIGICLIILAAIVSFPISDFAHYFLTSNILAPANSFFHNTLFIFNNLPILTVVAMVALLVFVLSRRADNNSSSGSSMFEIH